MLLKVEQLLLFFNCEKKQSPKCYEDSLQSLVHSTKLLDTAYLLGLKLQHIFFCNKLNLTKHRMHMQNAWSQRHDQIFLNLVYMVELKVKVCLTLNSPNTVHTFCLGQVGRIKIRKAVIPVLCQYLLIGCCVWIKTQSRETHSTVNCHHVLHLFL